MEDGMFSQFMDLLHNISKEAILPKLSYRFSVSQYPNGKAILTGDNQC